YGQHMGAALGFATRMLVGSLACFVHALLPFLFERTGSRVIAELHDRMIQHRRRAAPDAVEDRDGPLGATVSRV
ncbi:MAG: DUF6356 family protein, partial [Dongiaceae bacterium]